MNMVQKDRMMRPWWIRLTTGLVGAVMLAAPITPVSHADNDKNACPENYWTTGENKEGIYPFAVPAGCVLVVDASGINDEGNGFKVFVGPVAANSIRLNEAGAIQGSDGPFTYCERARGLNERGILGPMLAAGRVFVPDGYPRTIADCDARGAQPAVQPAPVIAAVQQGGNDYTLCPENHWTTGFNRDGVYPFAVPAGCVLVVDASGINDEGNGVKVFVGPVGANTIRLREAGAVQGSNGPLTYCMRARGLNERGILPAMLAANRVFVPDGYPKTIAECDARGLTEVHHP